MSSLRIRTLLCSIGALVLVAGACGSGEGTDAPIATADDAGTALDADAALVDAPEAQDPTGEDTSGGAGAEPASSNEAGGSTAPSDGGGGGAASSDAAASGVVLDDDASSIDVLSASLLADPDGPVRGEAEARCISEQVIDDIGIDRFAGLVPASGTIEGIGDLGLEQAEIDAVIDATFACVDVQALLTEELAGQFGDEQAQCLAGELDADTMKTMVSLAFEGGVDADIPPEFLETFFGLMETCGVTFGA